MMNETKLNIEKSNRNLRRFFFNCNGLLIALILIATAIIINLIAFRLNTSFDLTSNRFYSLSEQSMQTIAELNRQPNNLNIYGFFSGDIDRNATVDLIKEFQKHSGKITYRTIDPYKNQTETRQFQVRELGTLVFQLGDKDLKVLPWDVFIEDPDGRQSFIGEQAITRTIYKLIDSDTKSIHILIGHGEKIYQSAREYIKGAGYKVEYLDLMKAEKIPENCSQLIIAGPKSDLTKPEIKLIEEYLEHGGGISIFLDFPPVKANLANLIELINQWGIDTEDSVVLDTEKRSAFDYTMIIPNYLEHEITQKLDESFINLIFPFNRGLIKLENYSGPAKVEVIIESSNKSWGETDRGGNVKQDPHETAGPIPLGIAASRSFGDKEGRMVVIANSNFLDDQFVTEAGNLNLFYNITNWFLGQSERITIAPKQIQVTRVFLTPLQTNLIRWFVMLILPASILISGGVIWFRRRSR